MTDYRITEEGRLLFAALAKITTESQTDKTPYEVIEQLENLVNPITIRMETDDEYKKRIYKEKKQLEDVIKEELRKLERLKLKYGIK